MWIIKLYGNRKLNGLFSKVALVDLTLIAKSKKIWPTWAYPPGPTRGAEPPGSSNPLMCPKS